MGRKYSLGGGPGVNQKVLEGKGSGKRIMWFGRVIAEANDPEAAGRVKVRIKGLDDKKTDDEIPYSWPFLPLYLNIIPKKDETVKIILYDSKNEDSYREYIGPIIPQLGEKLLGAEHFLESRAGREGFKVPFFQSIKSIPTAKENLYPKEGEIAIQGRNNADLIFKDSEVLIRAGKFIQGDPNKKNEINPGYIQIKTRFPSKNKSINSKFKNLNSFGGDVSNSKKSIDYNKSRSDISFVGNKIFLIGRDDNSSIIKPYPTEEEWSEMENNLHPIAYGDILKDFIDKVLNWMQTHTHPYHNTPQNPAVPAWVELELWKELDSPKLLSKNIFVGGDIPRDATKLPILSANPIDTKNNETLVVLPKNISRTDEFDELPIHIDAQKVCDDNTCLVTFLIKNKITNETTNEVSGSGNSEGLAYANALTQLLTLLSSLNIPVSKIKIPQLNEIKIF